MKRLSINNFTGCIVGGAVGDALGAPVEFMSLPSIIESFGPNGISEYHEYCGQKGIFTDDTQMTLFTAEGLVLSKVRKMEHIPTAVYYSYLRWLSTQRHGIANKMLCDHGSCNFIDGQLYGFKELHSQRSPGNSCLSALSSGKMGTIDDPINNSKGCGGVMRIAPVGLFFKPEQVFEMACEIAAITHGHPTGYLASGCMAQIISNIISGDDLWASIEKSISILKTKINHEETLKAINLALYAWKNKPVSFETVESLGEGWIAEEALAISIYCAISAENDFEKALNLAVNHSGDSDSTGSITGNILGALKGISAIPSKFIKNLELFDVIQDLANDLLRNGN